jgi:hypothetical protein
MHLNPLPFVFAPGVLLAGYLLGGAHGTVLAGLLWTVIVSAATLCAFLRRHRTPQRG